MTCTSTVYGSGLNTNDCTSLGNYGNYTFNGYASFQPVTLGSCAGLRLFLDGVDQGHDYTFYTDAYVVSTTCPVPSTAYDCINGACTSKATYNTPGLYATLSDCQVACGTGCSGVCISTADWAQIQGLSDELRSRECG